MYKSIVEYLNDDGLAEIYKNGYLDTSSTDKIMNHGYCNRITPEKKIRPIEALVYKDNESLMLAEKINEIIEVLNNQNEKKD